MSWLIFLCFFPSKWIVNGQFMCVVVRRDHDKVWWPQPFWEEFLECFFIITIIIHHNQISFKWNLYGFTFLSKDFFWHDLDNFMVFLQFQHLQKVFCVKILLFLTNFVPLCKTSLPHIWWVMRTPPHMQINKKWIMWMFCMWNSTLMHIAWCTFLSQLCRFSHTSNYYVGNVHIPFWCHQNWAIESNLG